MADGIVLKHPQTGVIIFNTDTITAHSRAAFNTTSAAGSQSVADLLRGTPFVIQALPSTDSSNYNIPDFTVSGSTVSWSASARNMRVLVGSRAVGGPGSTKTFDGFAVRRDQGAIQVSTADFALQLVNYGSVVLTDDGANHPQPMATGSVTVSGVNPVLAFRPAAGARVTVTRVSVSGGNYTFHFRCQSVDPVGVIYWVFDVAGQALLLNTDVALVLKDNTTTKTFDSRAYAFNFVDHIVKTDDTLTTVNAPSGRTYAVVQSTYSYHGTFEDAGAFGFGSSPPTNAEIGDPSAPRPPGATWSYMQLRAVETTAAALSNGGVSVGMSQFEFYRDWYPLPGNNEQDLRYGTSRHTIIDVTGFPAAAMPQPTSVNVAVSATTREVTAQTATTANTISPAAVITVSGGIAPYTYLWQYVSGSTLIAAYDFTDSPSFRTQSLNQPGGEVREAVWRCRVTDSVGNVGYSQPVTFRHDVELIDYLPDPVNWQNANNSTTGSAAAVLTNYQTISGISHSITLRFVVTYTGNLSSGSFNVFSATRNQFIGTRTLGSGQVDVTVQPGEQINIYCDGATTSGVRSGQWSVEVRNEFASGGVIDTVALNLTVDSDNNYNVPDYTLTPGAISLQNKNFNSTTGDVTGSFGGGNANGINQPITLRAVVNPVYRGGAVDSYFTVYVGSTSRSWDIGQTGAKSFSFTVQPGAYVGVSAALSLFPGSGDGWVYWHMDLFNDSAGGVLVAGHDGGLTTSR